ncbi:MAG: hypothetical protein KDC78_03125 [Aequorivita sp.]|nr:hypothetical protein [Aequorivita sp.]
MKPKHHIIISVVVMAFLALLAYAKKKEVTKSIHWNERALTWDDFPHIDGIPGDYDAMVYSDIQFEGNREDQYLHIYAQMIPHKSGRVVTEAQETEQLLIHEQNHFNITEYFARLFRKEVIAIGKEKLTNEDLQRLGKKYLAKIDAMQDRYDKESKHNTAWNAQRYWELHIAGLLRETAYYANQDLYSYQEFTGGPTPWCRNIYNTLEGEILTSYPENDENSRYGEVYHIIRKQDSTFIDFYKNGKPTNGGYFEAARCIIAFPNATTRETKLFDAEGNPFSNDTEAHTTRTVTDAEGNIIRTYYDENGKQISKEGVFTQKGVWNAAKKSMYSTYFDKEGKPTTRRGAYKELRTMGDNKATQKISYFDRNDNPMRDTYFVSTYAYEVDANLMLASLKKFDVDGNYAIALDGYYTKCEYDERGKQNSEAYFDKHGNKTADVNGIHKYTYTYDLYANCTDLRKFNIKGFPTKGANDAHQLVSLYDTLGRNTFSAAYYPDYILKFSDTKDGATSYEFVGDTISIAKNVDAFGMDAANDSGIAWTKQFLNAKKEVVREEFYGTEGNWAKTEDGVAGYNYKYDERGNQIEIAAFDSLGKPHAWQEDVAITRWEYDKNNNRNKTTYFTVTDELAHAAQGATYNGFVYDDANNLVERTNYDSNMNPCLFDGVFRTSIVLNRFGKDSIVTNYDVKNEIIAGGGILKYTYNPRGILIAESVYNQNNQPVLNDFGVHKTVYNHDSYDRYLGYTYYGKNDERVNSIEGYASMQMELNASGFVLNYTYFDKNKKRVLGPEGFHKMENFYNTMDEVVRTSTYGTDQKLMNNAEGIADYVYRKDTSGRTIRISFYDADSNLTEDSSGIAEYFYTPSLNGLYYLEKQRNAKGEEVAIETETEEATEDAI